LVGVLLDGDLRREEVRISIDRLRLDLNISFVIFDARARDSTAKNSDFIPIS
jgi:hypothetical protein